MVDPLVGLTRRWFKALADRDASVAEGLVTEDCRITNPAGGEDLVGPAGARALVQMSPSSLRRTVRDEEVRGSTVVVRGLSRLPGVFVNYTTWTFETEGDRIKRLTFEWRAAN